MWFWILGDSLASELELELGLKLASELEPDLQDTMDWGKKWLVDFNAGKTQLVLFDQSNNTVTIDMKINGSVFEGN